MIKIAIVDDKRMLRQTLQEQLSAITNLKIQFVARNGEDFLQQVKALSVTERPEVVVMDIEMPVMNGIQAVASAKATYPEMEFLMLTVFDEDNKVFEAIKAGACGYLLKDEKPAIIAKAIYDIVEEKAVPMSPSIARKTLRLLANPSAQLTASTPQEDYALSDRETEILKLLVQGLGYKQIADQLIVSPHTIRKHIANIYKKLHVSSKASVINLATKKKWFLGLF